MRKFVVVQVSLLFFLIANVACKEEKMQKDLMPWPEQIEQLAGQFRLSDSFSVAFDERPSPRLQNYAHRMLRRLSNRTGLFLVNGGREPLENQAGLSIAAAFSPELALGNDESYELLIMPDGATLRAKTDIGAMRGLETMLQLLAADEKGYYLPAVKIVDAPRFPWRGLLIDVCRHFLPIEVIKRNIDGMAAVKLNVLHLHLTEDQGFRIESKTFPKLHELGSDGDYFTHEQIREIIAYAEARGIRVVPEFDMPGHVTSWLVGYPELASLPGSYQIERGYGVKDPSFDPSKESTYRFLDRFFQEMAALFPDKYMHIGGDENNGKHWDASVSVQEFKRKHDFKDNHEVQTYFNQRILKMLTKYGKQMVGWDEILQPDMPNNIVIQSWRGPEALVQSARQGYDGILSNGYYIDLMQPTDFYYLNDPLPEDSPLSDAERKHILGGEATMWSEIVTLENVDSRIWPRTAAIAERLWSPGQIKDVESMYRRLATINLQLEEHGLAHEKNVPMMLRRLAASDEISALQELVSLLEPVRRYERHSYRTYTAFSPMTRIVDIARADAPVARTFRNKVDALLSQPFDAKFGASLQMTMQGWQHNHTERAQMIEKTPALQEIAPHAQALNELAKVGLEALVHLSDSNRPKEAWLESARLVVEQAKAVHAETHLMIVSAIEKLVAAAEAIK